MPAAEQHHDDEAGGGQQEPTARVDDRHEPYRDGSFTSARAEHGERHERERAGGKRVA